MRSDHPDSLNRYERLFHVSEQPGIEEFIPRPSPSIFPGLSEDVVFAVSESLLVNYLLPRDCPRVTYYPSKSTSAADKTLFMGNTPAGHVIIVESAWYTAICQTRLFVYELPPRHFRLIDACAGYYVSPKTVKPLNITEIADVIPALLNRGAELRFTPNLQPLAEAVKASSLNFSIIRMQSAAK